MPFGIQMNIQTDIAIETQVEQVQHTLTRHELMVKVLQHIRHQTYQNMFQMVGVCMAGYTIVRQVQQGLMLQAQV